VIPKTLDKIEAADIQSLVTNGDEERRTLDFKRDLPGNTDKDKNELRADVTSFANAGGGDLIFGVDEAGGVATAVPGLPGVDADAEIRRIEAVIQTSIDPRVPGFESRAIAIPGKGPVIVVRVPKSWRGPHLVKINDTFRMFGRNSKGKYIFDATEIRSAFALSEQLPERIRRWRDDRLARIIGGAGPVALGPGALLVIHVVPLSSFAAGQQVSVEAIQKSSQQFPPLCEGGGDTRVNIDGLLKFTGGRAGAPGASSYCQVFRSGIVEGVSARVVNTYEDRPRIPSTWLVQKVVESVKQYRDGLLASDVAPPFTVLGTLSGAKGAILAVNQRFVVWDHYPVDRDFVSLPEALIESKDSDLLEDLRPLFDGVWNACGWVRCFDYNEQGKWAPPA
jgi:hypothetical protein